MDFDYKAVLTKLESWGIPKSHALAYGWTLLISLAPFLVLFIVRIENIPQHKNYLRIALSFASWGLLGDAFLHLIPHSMGHSHDHHSHDDHDHHSHHHDHASESHSHSHGAEQGEHDHMEQTLVGLYIVAGIMLFFLMEKFFIYAKGGSGHSHSHSHSPPKKNKKAKVSDSEGEEDSDSEEKLIKGSQKKGKNKRSATGQVAKTRFISGLLNLIADFLHNFTDGLAIGATFAAGNGATGTALGILMHEVPHEIGDYAILIQSGYKRSSAMALQLVTAIGALIGTAVGLYFGNLEQTKSIILPVTAGGFIYIATVTVLPELLEKTTSIRQTVLEILSMLAGIGFMFFIALNE